MPEQLKIENHIHVGNGPCNWSYQADKGVKAADNPGFCQYVAEPGKKLCQKHRLICERLNIDLNEGVNF